MEPDLQAGTDMAGYRVESLLARGGMGVVYLAEDLRLERKVALKVLAPELVSNESFRRRFIRESQLAAAIDHPNIIPIYQAGEANGQFFIAMRYVKGTDLRTVLEQERRLEPGRTLGIIRQVGRALDAAHVRGLVHRDVKPGNILIASGEGQEESSHVYLTDFGLTRRASSDSGLTGTGQFMGTIDYVAPEQVEGKSIDGRADEYALGCVMFECLAGQPPFDLESEVAVIYAHLTEPPPLLSTLRPDLPLGLDTIITTAMAKSPEDRYPTCAAMVAALRVELGTASSGGGVGRAVPPPPPAPPRATKPPLPWEEYRNAVEGVEKAGERPARTPTHEAESPEELAASSGAPPQGAAFEPTAVGGGVAVEPTSGPKQIPRAPPSGFPAAPGVSIPVSPPIGTPIAPPVPAPESPPTSPPESPPTSPPKSRRARRSGRAQWIAGAVVIVLVAVATVFLLTRHKGAVTEKEKGTGFAHNFDIWVMNPDGSGARDLTKNPAADDSGAAWSPDGTQIAFVSDRSGHRNIWVMNADGTSPRQLTSDPDRDQAPAWSPDGSTIAFVSNRLGNDDVWVMNAADGSNPHPITKDSHQDRAPAWSPDGKQIAFVSDRTGNSEIFVMNANGSAEHAITHSTEADSRPSWGSNDVILFQRGHGTRHILEMTPDGGGVKDLTKASKDDNSGASFSPDTKKIAFVSLVNGFYQIFVMDADGTSLTQLTRAQANASGPAWKPDGTLIAFATTIQQG